MDTEQDDIKLGLLLLDHFIEVTFSKNLLLTLSKELLKSANRKSLPGFPRSSHSPLYKLKVLALSFTWFSECSPNMGGPE